MKPYTRKLNGPRWGDVIRKELSIPSSELSGITRKFQWYKDNVKLQPKSVKIENFAGFIHCQMGDYIENISPYCSVSDFLEFNPPEKEIDYSI